MAIDKALYEAPQGLAAIEQAPPIEIEIEDPESVHINMDGMEIDLEKAEDNEEFNKNLAEDIDAGTLNQLEYEQTKPYDVIEPFVELYIFIILFFKLWVTKKIFFSSKLKLK
jgi:hypothetical protein